MSDRYILEYRALDEPHVVVPCEDLFRWGEWFETSDEQRRVGATDIGEAHVSTVFLALNHNWSEGMPILYETMIFGGEHDLAQWRWHTWEDAERGHAAVVAWLRGEGLEPE